MKDKENNSSVVKRFLKITRLNEPWAIIIAAFIGLFGLIAFQDSDNDGRINIVEFACFIGSCNTEFNQEFATPNSPELTLTSIVQTQTEIAKFSTPTPTSYTVPTETAIALTLTALAEPSVTITASSTSTVTTTPTITITPSTTSSHTPFPTSTSFLPATEEALWLTLTAIAVPTSTQTSQSLQSNTITSPARLIRQPTAPGGTSTYSVTLEENQVIVGNAYGLNWGSFNATGGCVVFRIYGANNYTFTVTDGVYEVWDNVEDLAEAESVYQNNVSILQQYESNCRNSSSLQVFQIP